MKNKLYLAIIALLANSSNIYAEEVPINDVLPVLATKKITEQPSNVWFLMDDSGSMILDYGMSYIPDVVYELPLDSEGNPFSLPRAGISFYSGRPNRNSSYFDPFITYTRTGSVSNARTKFEDNFCRNLSGAQRTNCRIWDSFYRIRATALKSSFSIAMKDVGRGSDTIRWGFDTLHTNNGVIRQIMPKDIKNSRKSLYDSVFRMVPNGGTPLRSTFADLISDIKQSILLKPQQQSNKHPDLFDIEKDYDAKSNPILSCRRNHTVLLTDGGWNQFVLSQDYILRKLYRTNFVKSTNINEDYLQAKKFVLPDGMLYKRHTPYYQRPSRRDVLSLADIAFVGWANDLNDNKDDNNLLMLRPRLPDKDGNMIYYANNNVSGSGTIPSSLTTTDPGSPITEGQYWHPYNDPASWQHINTHTIAFGLGNNNIPDINPPKTIDEAKQKSRYIYDIEKFINGSARFDLPDSSERIDQSYQVNMVIDDMARSAVAGRGQFHSVVTPQALTSAFKSIFDAISDSNNIGASVNRGSAAAVASGSVGSAQTLFTAQFNPVTFAGEMIAFPVYDGKQTASDCWVEPQLSQYTDNGNILASVAAGTFCNNPDGAGAWKASDSTNNLKHTTRNVYTSALQKVGKDEIKTLADYEKQVAKGTKLKLEPVEFTFDNLQEYRKNTSTGSVTEDVVNYIRGDETNEVRKGGSFRNRVEKKDSNNKWILGDIGRSAPVFASSTPIISNDHIVLTDDSALNAYSEFRNKKRKDMVYFGSNDGMLHALDASVSKTKRTDREQFTYVPHMLFDKLPKITKANEHHSFVDGKITIETVYENEGKSANEWHLRLAAGLGSGGKGVFSLDVSNDMGGSAKAFIDNAKVWEYGEKASQAYNAKDDKPGKSNIGNILARPGIIQVRNKTDESDSGWVVAVGNGYNAESNKAALILIDLFTGEVIQELVLDTSTNQAEHRHYIDNSKTNGLGPLYFLSYEGKDARDKYEVERAYAGDLQGNLWVFDFSNFDIAACKSAKDKADKVKYCVRVASNQFDDNNIIPLFTAVDKNGKRQPITVAPLVEEHPIGFGYLVHFGTGALFDRNDLSLFEKGDPDTPIVNSIYAIWDDWVPFGIGNGSGLEKPKTTPILFERDNKSELRALEWKRETVANSNGDSIEVRTLNNRDKNDYIPKTTWALERADTDPKGHVDKRGWFIDLDPAERAWQRPFVAFGENNVRSISYVTTTYPDKDNNTGTPTCTSSTEAPFSWTIAFDPDDGSQLLSGSGTLDTNFDGRICKSCAKSANSTGNGLEGDLIKDGNGSGVEIAATAVRSTDVLLSNSEPTPTPPGEGLTSCPGLMQITSNANNSANSQAIACRPLLPSSWQELK